MASRSEEGLPSPRHSSVSRLLVGTPPPHLTLFATGTAPNILWYIRDEQQGQPPSAISLLMELQEELSFSTASMTSCRLDEAVYHLHFKALSL